MADLIMAILGAACAILIIALTGAIQTIRQLRKKMERAVREGKVPYYKLY